ncbi:TniQ family protein [Streptomyces sp. HUCO-GS316]|uniref:TniQ family protein n=1 Tax=Streptomyces sp. HUCO-GS316 TaxID=2692198 RepID=UPI00301C55FC
MTTHTASRPALRAHAMWPTPPGALRVRPLPRETTASYLTRLATAYHLSAAQLLNGLHITTTGTPTGPPATEIHLSNEAARHLSDFTRIPPAHLARALARQPPPAAIGTAHAAIARWQPVQPAMQPLPACTACTAHRSPHKAVPAWIHPAPNLPRALICTRHQQAASDHRQRTPSTSVPSPNSPTPASPPAAHPQRPP